MVVMRGTIRIAHTHIYIYMYICTHSECHIYIYHQYLHISIPQVSLTTGGGPSAVSSSHRQQHPAPARVPTGPLKPEQVAKLLSEMDIVRRNMDIMNEILSETEPGKGTPDDIQLLDVSGELTWVLYIYSY